MKKIVLSLLIIFIFGCAKTPSAPDTQIEMKTPSSSVLAGCGLSTEALMSWNGRALQEISNALVLRVDDSLSQCNLDLLSESLDSEFQINCAEICTIQERSTR